MMIKILKPIYFLDIEVVRPLCHMEAPLEPATYEVERIENPFKSGINDFIVIKGTHLGVAEAYLNYNGIFVE